MRLKRAAFGQYTTSTRHFCAAIEGKEEQLIKHDESDAR